MDGQNPQNEWQPTQPVAPAPMAAVPQGNEVPPAPVAPEPVKKGGHGLLIGIIVFVVIILGIVLAVVLITNNNLPSSSEESNNTSTVEEPDEEEEEEEAQPKPSEAALRARRNVKREDDISRFMTAVNDFQTNNNGKTPFMVGLIGSFTRRYIDDTCEISEDAKTVIADTCSDDFMDPDGTQYEWSIEGELAEDETRVIDFSAVDHKIHVYQFAKCSDNDGEVEYRLGARNVALLYIEEGEMTVCADNS